MDFPSHSWDEPGPGGSFYCHNCREWRDWDCDHFESGWNDELSPDVLNECQDCSGAYFGHQEYPPAFLVPSSGQLCKSRYCLCRPVAMGVLHSGRAFSVMLQKASLCGSRYE